MFYFPLSRGYFIIPSLRENYTRISFHIELICRNPYALFLHVFIHIFIQSIRMAYSCFHVWKYSQSIIDSVKALPVHFYIQLFFSDLLPFLAAPPPKKKKMAIEAEISKFELLHYQENNSTLNKTKRTQKR